MNLKVIGVVSGACVAASAATLLAITGIDTALHPDPILVQAHDRLVDWTDEHSSDIGRAFAQGYGAETMQTVSEVRAGDGYLGVGTAGNLCLVLLSKKNVSSPDRFSVEVISRYDESLHATENDLGPADIQRFVWRQAKYCYSQPV